MALGRSPLPNPPTPARGTASQQQRPPTHQAPAPSDARFLSSVRQAMVYSYLLSTGTAAHHPPALHCTGAAPLPPFHLPTPNKPHHTTLNPTQNTHAFPTCTAFPPIANASPDATDATALLLAFPFSTLIPSLWYVCMRACFLTWPAWLHCPGTLSQLAPPLSCSLLPPQRASCRHKAKTPPAACEGHGLGCRDASPDLQGPRFDAASRNYYCWPYWPRGLAQCSPSDNVASP